MTAPGLRTRPSRSQRISMLLKRQTTAATSKYGIGGAEKRIGKPKPVSLAPVRGSEEK